MEIVIFALLLALLAGLSTTIGCVIALLVKKPSPVFISIAMGFSAGVMILVSFVELLQEGINANGFVMGIIFFFVGMFIMFLIDATISHEYEFEDSVEILKNEDGSYEYRHKECGHKSHSDDLKGHGHGRGHRYCNHCKETDNGKLEKTCFLVFIGVFIHNIPEGMATFIGTVKAVELGILLAIAIALHNIPEGIAVSVPIYATTKSRKKAFFWSFLSGISEFIGALFVAIFLYPFINDYILGAMLSIVAGIMIYISLDELLPVSRSFGKEHFSILGLMAGMAVMALTLALL